MYQKLFQITIVLFFVVVSIAALAVLATALLGIFSSPLLARGHGIVSVEGGVSARRLGYMIVAGSLLVAGFYVFIRRSRLR